MDFNTVVKLFRGEAIVLFRGEAIVVSATGIDIDRCEQFLEGLIKKTYNLKVCVYISLLSNFIHVYIPGASGGGGYTYEFGIDFENEDQFLALIMKYFLFS